MERAAIDQLHHQVAQPKLLTDVKATDDVLMVQSRHHHRFALEAVHELLVIHEMPSENFERDLTTKLEILGSKHRAHAALADEGLDQVIRYCDRLREIVEKLVRFKCRSRPHADGLGHGLINCEFR